MELTHEQAHEKLKNEPELPAESIHGIVHQHPNIDTYRLAIKHPNTSETTLKHIDKELDKHPDSGPELQQKIKAHPNASQKTVEGELKHIENEGYDDGVHSGILFHPKVSAEKRFPIIKHLADKVGERSLGFSASYDAERAVKKHFENPVPTSQLDEMVEHPKKEVAEAAAKNPSATKKHHAAYLGRDLEPSERGEFINETEGLHPDLLREEYDRAKAFKPKEGDWHQLRAKNEIGRAIASHPNTSPEILKEIAKGNDEEETYSSDSPQKAAIANPKLPLDVVRKKLSEIDPKEDVYGHRNLSNAAIRRPDLPEDMIRDLYATHKGDDSKYSNVIHHLAKHPNFPEDLQVALARGKTDEARALLGRKDLSENVLKEIINHKNQNVAVEALKHPSVNENVVQAAYKRKAAAVSRAASEHDLATDEMRDNKVEKDPVAAAEAAKSSQDPELLRSIAKNHIKNKDVYKALLHNPNTPGEVAEKLHDIGMSDNESPLKGYEREEIDKHIIQNPNISRDRALQILNKNPYRASYMPEGKFDEGMARQLLEGWKSNPAQGDNQRFMEDFGATLLNRQDTSPELAKEIVQGKYGVPNSRYMENNVHERPHMTPDVVQAGLSTPHELASPDLVGQMVQSKHLSPEGINQLADKAIPAEGDDSRDTKRWKEAVSQNLLDNPNVPVDLARKVLKNEHPAFPMNANAKSVYNHPELTPEDLKEHAAALDENKLADVGGYIDAAKAINKHGVGEDVLKTTKSPHLAQVLAHELPDEKDRGYYNRSTLGKPIPERHAIGMFENPNSEIAEHLAGNIPSLKHEPGGQEVIDKVAEHPIGQKIGGEAFPHMSPDAQAKVAEQNSYDPAIIRHSKPEFVKKLKITPDLSSDQLRVIAAHQGASDQQISDIIEHSPEGAHQVLESHGVNHSRLTEEQKMRMLEKYPDYTPVTRDIAKRSYDHKILHHIMDNPEKYGSAYGALIENPSLTTKDFDRLATKKHVGPELNPAFHAVAGERKTSVKLLQHIAENYPDLHTVIAKNPKAVNGKIIKTIVNHGNVEAMANLATNKKVPEPIKEELLKNKGVFLQVNQDHYVDPAHLNSIAESEKDPGILQYVVGHRSATPNVIDTAWNQAKSMPEDQKDKIGHAIALRGISKLSPQTAEEVAAASPERAVNLIHSTPSAADVKPETVGKIMDQHKNDQNVLRAVSARGGFHNEDLQKKIADGIDLNQKESFSALHDMYQELYARGSGRNFPAPAVNQVVYDKLKSLPSASSATQDHASLLAMLAKGATPQMQEDMLHHQELYPWMLQNSHLKPEVAKQMVDKINPDSTNGFQVMAELAKHDALGGPELDKLYRKADESVKSSGDGKRVIQAISERQQISPDVASHIFDNHTNSEILENPALPGEKLKEAIQTAVGPVKDEGDSNRKFLLQSNLENIGKNPSFKLSHLNEVMPRSPDTDKLMGNHPRRKALIGLAQNPAASAEDVAKIYDEGGADPYIYKKLIVHPNTSEEIGRDMLAKKVANEKDLFSSPSFGGKLWRSTPHPFPQSVPGLQPGKENHKAIFRPREEKVRSVISQIPADGYIEWASFKKAQPSLANDPVIQKMFTSAPKQRLTTEHANSYLENLPGSKEFHVSYQSWNGIQRHNDNNPQLVVNIDNGQGTESALKSDNSMMSLYKLIQDASNYSAHPINPQAIGWSRVDTSNPQHWFVDEIQSDFNSSLSRELDNINKEGRSVQLEQKYGLDAKSGNKAVTKMVDAIQGWEKALLSNIMETAKAHGVKKISIHSGKSKTRVNKGSNAEVTNKYDKIYNKLPQELGFQPDHYRNLPTADQSNPLSDDDDYGRIWTLDMDAAEEAKKQGDLFGEQKKAPEKKSA